MSELTQELLKKVLHYCPDTGVFTWLKRPRSMFTSDKGFGVWNAKLSGKRAGSLNFKGYRELSIKHCPNKRSRYLTHRLAWLYIHGEFPEVIDHINGVKDDNRLVNLRNTTNWVNKKNSKIYANNTSGIPGVSWESKPNKWRVRIKADKKDKHLGFFDNLFDAACARKSAELIYDYHPNHGRR